MTYAEIEQLERAVREHLKHGSERGNSGFGGVAYRSLAPEPVEHQWQRIVDALPECPSERAWLRTRLRRQTARYGCRRLRSGNEYHWAGSLTVVRAETAEVLRQLGHERLAQWVDGDAMPSHPRGPAVQMELSL